MTDDQKHHLYKYLNIAAIIVILTLVVVFRDRFRAMVAPKGKVLVENTAPELTEGKWINSSPMKLSSLRGKVVVIEFWAFECINCRHILPTLQSWFEKYSTKNVVFIAIHTPETVEEHNTSSLKLYVKENKITFPILTDNSYTNWNRYNVEFWPTTFLIDKRGVIRNFHFGELGFSSLESIIQSLSDE